MDKLKCPVIRFSQYKNDWDEIRLGDVIDNFSYGLNAQAIKYDGKHKYIRITDIDDNSRFFLQDNLTSPDINFEKADNYILTKKDILFARTGASVGKTYLYNETDGLVYFAGFLVRGKIKNDINDSFIFANTQTERFNKFIRLTSQRSGQPGINAKEYATFEFYCSDIQEQTQIGNFFQNLDQSIALHEKKLSQTQNLKKAMLEKMFPKAGSTQPEIRLKGFSGEWEQRELGEYCDMFNGDRGINYPNADDMVAVGIPFINAGDLQNGKVNLQYANKITRDKYNRLNGAKIQLGDIVYCLRGTLGKNAYIDNFTEGTVASSLVVIRPKNIIGSYLFQILNSDIEYRQRTLCDEGAAQPNLSARNLAGFLIPIPSLEEQKEIGNFFKQLDETLVLQQQQLQTLKNLKQAFLEKMFV